MVSYFQIIVKQEKDKTDRGRQQNFVPLTTHSRAIVEVDILEWLYAAFMSM